MTEVTSQATNQTGTPVTIALKEVPNELAIILGTTETFKDFFGKEHKLYPLEMADVIDITEKYGGIEALDRLSKLEDVIYLVWLSARKDALSDEEIEDKKWKLKTTTVARWFGMAQGDVLLEVLNKILKISGLTLAINEDKGKNEKKE